MQKSTQSNSLNKFIKRVNGLKVGAHMPEDSAPFMEELTKLLGEMPDLSIQSVRNFLSDVGDKAIENGGTWVDKASLYGTSDPVLKALTSEVVSCFGVSKEARLANLYKTFGVPLPANILPEPIERATKMIDDLPNVGGDEIARLAEEFKAHRAAGGKQHVQLVTNMLESGHNTVDGWLLLDAVYPRGLKAYPAEVEDSEKALLAATVSKRALKAISCGTGWPSGECTVLGDRNVEKLFCTLATYSDMELLGTRNIEGLGKSYTELPAIDKIAGLRDYRQVSLLLKRPSGREAYKGIYEDVELLKEDKLELKCATAWLLSTLPLPSINGKPCNEAALMQTFLEGVELEDVEESVILGHIMEDAEVKDKEFFLGKVGGILLDREGIDV